jgi:hypothetical protein
MPFVKVTLIDNEEAAFWTVNVKKAVYEPENKCVIIIFTDNSYWEVKGNLDEIVELINHDSIHDFYHYN